MLVGNLKISLTAHSQLGLLKRMKLNSLMIDLAANAFILQIRAIFTSKL